MVPYLKTKQHQTTPNFTNVRLMTVASPAAAKRIVPMANARKILIVDDDTDLRDTLVEQLSLHDEFEASAVDTGAKGATAAKANSPDLVLMDVGLPDTDGGVFHRAPLNCRLHPPCCDREWTGASQVRAFPT